MRDHAYIPPTTNRPLPEGYVARAPVIADAQAVYQLTLPNAIQFHGKPDSTVQDVLDEWNDPNFSIEHDARIVFSPEGELMGYAVLYEPHSPHPYIDVYVHQRLWNGDGKLDDWLVRFCRDRVEAASGSVATGVRVAMRAYTYARDERYKAKLRQHGFQSIRTSFWMGIDFENHRPQTRELASGLTMQRIETRDDALWREVFDVKRDAWRDHFGTIERDYETEFTNWKHDWASHFQPGMWIVVRDAGQMVGICLCETGVRGDPKLAWVNTLGVRRSHRRRGIADAL